MSQQPDQSDAAVLKATGRTWDQWEELLDGLGAAERSHREIVALVAGHGGEVSGWWQQSVAVGYEKLKGKRKTGETADAGVQVGVQRTLEVNPERAWQLLTSAEGVRAWLGAGARLRFEEGERYRTDDGAEGEVRVVRPGRHVRLTRHPKGWPRPSTMQVRVEGKGERAVIGFHEEHLPDLGERERRREHYAAAAETLKELAAP
jgi:uncharacterized protein YndB with AHSA1/START domain